MYAYSQEEERQREIIAATKYVNGKEEERRERRAMIAVLIVAILFLAVMIFSIERRIDMYEEKIVPSGIKIEENDGEFFNREYERRELARRFGPGFVRTLEDMDRLDKAVTGYTYRGEPVR
jgi:predicted nucleic acid-binding Zn ribbon protein